MTNKKQLDISDNTLKRIAEFFLNTSVPRIIAEERKKGVDINEQTYKVV